VETHPLGVPALVSLVPSTARGNRRCTPSATRCLSPGWEPHDHQRTVTGAMRDEVTRPTRNYLTDLSETETYD
jgi:hypothetical protein